MVRVCSALCVIQLGALLTLLLTSKWVCFPQTDAFLSCGRTICIVEILAQQQLQGERERMEEMQRTFFNQTQSKAIMCTASICLNHCTAAAPYNCLQDYGTVFGSSLRFGPEGSPGKKTLLAQQGRSSRVELSRVLEWLVWMLLGWVAGKIPYVSPERNLGQINDSRG